MFNFVDCSSQIHLLLNSLQSVCSFQNELPVELFLEALQFGSHNIAGRLSDLSANLNFQDFYRAR